MLKYVYLSKHILFRVLIDCFFFFFYSLPATFILTHFMQPLEDLYKTEENMCVCTCTFNTKMGLSGNQAKKRKRKRKRQGKTQGIYIYIYIPSITASVLLQSVKCGLYGVLYTRRHTIIRSNSIKQGFFYYIYTNMPYMPIYIRLSNCLQISSFSVVFASV